MESWLGTLLWGGYEISTLFDFKRVLRINKTPTS